MPAPRPQPIHIQLLIGGAFGLLAGALLVLSSGVLWAPTETDEAAQPATEQLAPVTAGDR